jgi:hypothetical protein
MGYTNITLTGYRDNGDMGMIILDVGADLSEVDAGTHSCNYSESGQVSISSVACASGSSDDDYYDAPATECEVEITDTADGREVVVTAEYPQYDNDGYQVGTTSARGSFTVRTIE